MTEREMTTMIPKVLICGTGYMGMKCAEVSTLEEGQVWGGQERIQNRRSVLERFY